MPYDQTLDVASFKEVIDFEKTRITVSIYSYNGGTKKLQFSRENLIEDEWSFVKLGRMNKEEVEKVASVMIQATEEM